MKILKIIYLCLLVSVAACSTHDEDKFPLNNVIGQPTISDVSSNSALLRSLINQNYIGNYKTIGFCYSQLDSPTVQGATLFCDVEEGVISALAEGLTNETRYFVRAFAYKSRNEVIYSDQVEFITKKGTLEEQLADYVAPSYKDDYTSISGWDQRNEWNLANVHDPTVMLADDGYYYMYQTDASYGNSTFGHGHFHARRSRDLINWEYLGATMPQGVPSWVDNKLSEYRTEMGLPDIVEDSYGCWAPVARKISTGKYRMYYSWVVTNYIKTGAPEVPNGANFDNSWTERAFIGMMECSDPALNNWTDCGFVVGSSSDKGMNDYARQSLHDWSAYFKINAIDPTYTVTPDGKHWLTYGSWHSGIATIEIDPADGKPVNELGDPWDISGSNNSGYGKIVASRGNSRWQPSEGPEIIYRDGYYYMFLAYGTLAVEYNTRVCRSESIDGEYVDMYGNSAMGSSDLYPIVTAPYKFRDNYGWVGISHCSIFEDGNDNWFYSSQGRFPENVGGNPYSNALMMGHVRSIVWTDEGWPLVLPQRYGAVPQVKITESEIGGEWEHIALTNNTSVQRESEFMNFDSDLGRITSGSWNGASYTFDYDSQTITTSSGVKLYLRREVDWEASPRHHTIVYVAHGDHKTYWGKKVK